MNFFDLIKLFSSGGSIWGKIGSILLIAAGIAGSFDANTTGSDDIAAGIMATAGDALNAYDKKDYNRTGNLIDATIAGLQRFKQFMVDNGQIKPAAVPPGNSAVMPLEPSEVKPKISIT